MRPLCSFRGSRKWRVFCGIGYWFLATKTKGDRKESSVLLVLEILTSCVTSSCRSRTLWTSAKGRGLSFPEMDLRMSLNACVCSASRFLSLRSSARDSSWVRASCKHMRSGWPCPVWFSRSWRVTNGVEIIRSHIRKSDQRNYPKSNPWAQRCQMAKRAKHFLQGPSSADPERWQMSLNILGAAVMNRPKGIIQKVIPGHNSARWKERPFLNRYFTRLTVSINWVKHRKSQVIF